MTLRRPITAVILGIGIALVLPTAASAHSIAVECSSPGWFEITNDYPSTANLTSPNEPGVTVLLPAGNGATALFPHSGDNITITAIWTSDGFTQTVTVQDDCTNQTTTTTTTIAQTTTTIAETTTSTTELATTSTIVDTTTPTPGTSTTTTPGTTTPGTTTPGTSTTSTPPTTAPPSESTTPPPTPPGEPRLPATGSDISLYLIGLGLLCVALGSLIIYWDRQ